MYSINRENKKPKEKGARDYTPENIIGMCCSRRCDVYTREKSVAIFTLFVVNQYGERDVCKSEQFLLLLIGAEATHTFAWKTIGFNF